MKHVGREQTVYAEDRAYRLSRFTRGLVRRWIEWAKSVLPDPCEGLGEYLYRFPPAVQLRILEETNAILEAREDLDDPEMRFLWESEEGLRQMFFLMLEKHHWNERPEPVYEAVRQKHDLRELVLTASGSLPKTQREIQDAYYASLGWLPPPLPSKRKRRTDWQDIDRELFKNFNITPAQIDELTLTELQVICQAEQQADKASELEKAKFYVKLTAEQKADLERLLLLANT